MKKSQRGQELETHLKKHILENLYETSDTFFRYINDSLDKIFNFNIKVLELTESQTGHCMKLSYQDEKEMDRIMDVTITSNSGV